ncbi:MAG: LysM peptidoglycan-binding domain-containing protein [Ilumatobacter sp.]|jgi:nucleoid-associated protein YgaU|uniref:CIS tube protein n=1 Tax=Ilumatobacter sp. TaxID=1967498 RepID=UPI00391C64B2
MASQLQKAYLEVESGGRIDCMFNPTTFAFATQNRWESDQIPGKNTPSLRYAGGAGGSFSLSLVFDTTGTGKAVTAHTNKLLKLMEVDEKLAGYDSEKNNGRPPWVKFHWGTHLHSFKAVISSTNVTFTYFSNEGLPLRANVELSLEQYEPDANWGPQNPTSGTPNPKRTHQVQVGETLDRIAGRYFGDPTRWRDIAQLNGIADPLDLKPGRLLAIPERGR